MIGRSNITWTDFSGGDANVVIRGRVAGDCEVSPGCAHCYAGGILRRSGQTPETTKFYPDKLARLVKLTLTPGLVPFRRGSGSRPMVFLCDMGDLFHDAVPDWFILDVLNAVQARADVDWQVLTKRPARMLDFVRMLGGWPANVWAGVSVEDQTRAAERIPLLLKVPAQVRFLSMEPLLRPVDLRPWLPDLHWVIVGGESGPKRRPFDKAWARVIRDQCQAAGVPFFFKQGGALRPGQDHLLDERLCREFPQVGG